MHTTETRQKIAASVKRAHALHPRTEETRNKLSDGVKRAYCAGRAMGFKTGNTCGRLRTDASKHKAHAACMKAVIGSHGFGVMQRGLPDHLFAKHWVIQSPEGIIYEFDNLHEWCRAHEYLFEDSPGGEWPLWKRASHGLQKPQWKGWIVIKANAGGQVHEV